MKFFNNSQVHALLSKLQIAPVICKLRLCDILIMWKERVNCDVKVNGNCHG